MNLCERFSADRLCRKDEVTWLLRKKKPISKRQSVTWREFVNEDSLRKRTRVHQCVAVLIRPS